MRVIVSGKKRQLITTPVIAVALVCVITCAVFFFMRGGDGEPATVETDKMDSSAVSAMFGTLECFGARSAEDAINIWAEGVCARNGMTQYAVMKSDLKEKYAEVAEKKFGSMLFPTGAERIDSWFVADVTENEDGSSLAKLRFTISSTIGESVPAIAELTIEQEGEFTVVSSVAVEKPLYDFTGIG